MCVFGGKKGCRQHALCEKGSVFSFSKASFFCPASEEQFLAGIANLFFFAPLIGKKII